MKISKEFFGLSTRGETVQCYVLENAAGLSLGILDYGCTIRFINIPRGEGKSIDVALGYDSIKEYEENDGYLGAVVGRHANRIGGACFSLGGREYQLAKNDGCNHLHGGSRGFDKYVWQAEARDGALRFSRLSPDGEEAYPGNLAVSVEYYLSDDNALHIRYWARSDKDTVINLTNHCYFNLNGHDSGSAMGHRLRLAAEEISENSDQCLPTGKFIPVAGGEFDFRREKAIGRDIENNNVQLANCGGYDHNFVLEGRGLREIGCLSGEKSGISMSVFTDQPGIQLYSGNFLDKRRGKGGAVYDKRHGICLETQHFPNAMANPNFPSVVLKAGKEFLSRTIYKFDF